MAKKIRVWDGTAWQDVAPSLPYTAIHSAQASMPATGVDGQVWLDTDGTLAGQDFVPLSGGTMTGNLNTPSINAGGIAGQNYVINGGFDIWQRGTSFVSPSALYTTDRWTNDASAMTLSRQSSGAPAGSLYYFRTTSTGSSAYTDFYHFFETSNISILWGKTVTYSYKVRKSGTTPIGSFILTLQKSATVDAGRSSTWSTIVSTSTAFSNISTGTSSNDWTTITATAIIPNDGSANSLRLVGGFDNGQSSGVVVDLAQVKLEVGPVATPFSRAQGTIAGELAACQRYYIEGGADVTWCGNTTNGSSYFATTYLPVVMRVAPTLSLTSQNGYAFPNTVGSVVVGKDYFRELRTANNSISAGFFGSTYKASAEL
jgi:hypothetical protein